MSSTDHVPKVSRYERILFSSIWIEETLTPLRAEIEPSPFADRLDKSIFIWSDDFKDRVQDAIDVVKRLSTMGRSIWLLDQYGWSDVAFRSMSNVLSELEKAEIFLTFSVDSLIDYMSEKRLEQRGVRRQIN